MNFKLLCAFLLAFAASTQAAYNVQFRMRNNSGSTITVKYMHSSNGGTTWNTQGSVDILANSTATANLSGLTAAESFKCEYGTTTAGSYHRTGDCYITGGWGNPAKISMDSSGLTGTQPYPIPSSSTYFEGGQSEPIINKFKLGLHIVNNTFNDQLYFLRSNNVVVVQTPFRVGPGNYFDIVIADQSAPWPWSVRNLDGDYPAFGVAGSENDAWKVQDTYTGPVTLNHVFTATAGGTNMAWTLIFDHPQTPEETNALSEGTYKQGTENLFTLQKQQGEQMITVLRTITEQLGGNTLSTAATNINQAGGSINGASSNVLAASATLNNAAGNLSSSLTNIGTVQGYSSNAVSEAKNTGIDANTLTNAVPNPYANYTIGVGAGGTWGGSSPGNAMGTMWLMPSMGLVSSVNLNPILEPHLGPMAPIIHGMLVWASSFALIVFCMKVFQNMMTKISSACQAQGTAILGNTWATGIVTATVIILLLGSIPVLWLTFRQGHGAGALAIIGVDPLTYLPGSDALMAFVPMDTFALHLGYGFTFWGGCLSAYIVASMGIRVLPR